MFTRGVPAACEVATDFISNWATQKVFTPREAFAGTPIYPAGQLLSVYDTFAVEHADELLEALVEVA